MGDHPKSIDANLVSAGPSDATREAIRAAVADSIVPVRSRTLGTRVLMVLVAGVAALVVAVISFGSKGLGAVLHNGPATLVGFAVALVGTLALAISFAPGLQHRIGRRAKMAMVVLLVAGWSLYISQTAHLGTIAAIDSFAWGCAARGLAAGAVAGAIMAFVWFRADPWTPRISGALIGAAAGCVAAAGVGIPCASEHAGHLAIGHWLVVPLLALIGALLARRSLAP